MAQKENFQVPEAQGIQQKARTLYRLFILILLLFEAFLFLVDGTMRALILLPIFMLLSLLSCLVIGIPARKALAAALNPSNSRRKRWFFLLLFGAPYLLVLSSFFILHMDILRDNYGNDPGVWEKVFYENESLLNDINQTLMNPNRAESWYIAEIHASQDNQEIEILVVEKSSGNILEQGSLKDSQILSDHENQKILLLLKKFRIPFSYVNFEHNLYVMEKDSGVFARFSIGRDSIPTHNSNYATHYEEGRWFLFGCERPQHFDDPPMEYYSYLNGQSLHIIQ